MNAKTDQIQIKEVSKLADNVLLAMALSAPQAKYYSLQFTGKLLANCENSLQELYTTPISELHQRLGLPLADSYRLKAMFELANRRMTAKVLDKSKISTSKEAYELFHYLGDARYEEFWIVILNKANRAIELKKISEGGISGTVVDIKRIFHETLMLLGSSLILAHNHPSGNVNPSEADQAITKKIVEAGKFLDIIVGLRIFCPHQFH